MPNYQTNLHAVYSEARALLEQEGLTAKGWKFQVNNRIVATAGRCNYRRKIIEHSASHLEHSKLEFNIDTVRHEVAHAVAGPGTGHGPVWQAEATRLGADPTARYDVADAGEKMQAVMTEKREWICVSVRGETVEKQFTRERIGRPLNDGMWTKGKKALTKGTLHYVHKSIYNKFLDGHIDLARFQAHLTRDGKTKSFSAGFALPVAARAPAPTKGTKATKGSTYTAFTAGIYQQGMTYEEFLVEYLAGKPNSSLNTVKAQYGRIKKAIG